MAEALVDLLLKQISDLLRKERRLAAYAKMELESLKDLIGATGKFLEEANSREAIDENLKASMKRAREFLYESQDAIDDLMQRELKHNWECLGPCFGNHYNRRTFASEAKDIRKMLEINRTTKSKSACRPSSPIAFVEENDDELVGIERAREQLVQWLAQNGLTSEVIFVHGAQGVGKTSLVGSVLRDQRVRSHFKYYVWIKVLGSCELVEDKAAALLKANAEIWDATQHDNLGIQLELKEVFRSLRNENVRWALVLDDAGRTHVFESLWSHLAHTRPSVIVTTCDSSLVYVSKAFLYSREAQCDSAAPEPARLLYGFHSFKHVFLSMNDSFTLFCQKTFRSDACPDFLKDVSHSILQKCGGLPLAILATSNLLINIQDGGHGTPQSVEWRKLSDRLGEALLSKSDTSGLIRRMITLRTYNLHDVRACLFYLSIFPLDCPIRCSTLMRLWMAERFVQQKSTSAVQSAEITLKKLLDLNLIQEVEKRHFGKVKTCHVHNILHQIIISKSKDDEFAMIVDDLEEQWPEIIWRLSFHRKMDAIKDSTSVKRLRSLFVFKKVNPASLKNLLRQVVRLNVLDLQFSSLNSFPKEILGLKYLRYLSLRGTYIDNIPDGIGDLAHLETLDLKDTCVSELPNGILKLKALRHLLVCRSDRSPAAGTHTKYGVEAPLKLGVLTSLQKLCLIELKQVKQSTLSGIFHIDAHALTELGKLVSLRRLGISKLRSKDVALLCPSIEKLSKLEALHLIAAAAEILDLSKLDERKAPQNLQRVHLTGRLGTLPMWILSSMSLVKLVLESSQLNEDPFQHLRNLPRLKHLELQQAFDASEIKFEAGGFPQLCFLGLDTFDNLAYINAEEEALPTLERLSLARCRSLTTVPQVVTQPRQLKWLELYAMPEKFMRAVRGNEEIPPGMEILVKDWNDTAVEEPLRLPRRFPIESEPSTSSLVHHHKLL